MFKAFPIFTKLTLGDRDEYESYVKDFPPVSDITFASMMAWWGSLDGLAVATLNGNLVISYWIPGDDEHSGLSIVGNKDIDESICVIFDYMRERGEQPRLVNVAEFVVNNLDYPELFNFKTGLGDDEYLISLTRFATFESMPFYMRRRVRKFLRIISEENLEIKEIDFSSPQARLQLLDSALDWPLKGVNNINKLEREVLPVTIASGQALGIRGVGVYISGILQAYTLYFPTNDRSYAIVGHARMNYDIPYIFDYAVHAISQHMKRGGIKYFNLHADGGSQKMRVLKLALKPENFFRKYTIEPTKTPSRMLRD